MNYCYFENRDCEYYPCHEAEHINCLFCFCPLYHWENCGGQWVMTLTEKGEMVKDCSHCLLPHSEEGYDYVVSKLREVSPKSHK
ncbi:MAG: cysteine-rich small domain-containing protein [Clostridia bacterium]|nr:cysteine-rich small domain-containing protein [Clostridia bacterium]